MNFGYGESFDWPIDVFGDGLSINTSKWLTGTWIFIILGLNWSSTVLVTR